MADTKISNLAAVTSLGDTDEAVLAVGGASKKIAGANIFATPAIVLGSSAAAGSAGHAIRSDGTIAAFDATAPSTQAFGDAAAVGTAAFAARRDHKHAFPSLGTGATNACAGNDSRLSDARVPTPGPVGGVIWTSIVKASDTSVASTTTMAVDPGLQFTSVSGTVYEFEAVIVYASPAGGGTPDIKVTMAEDGTLRGIHVNVGLDGGDFGAVTGTGNSTSFSSTRGTAITNRGFYMAGTYVGGGGTAGIYWAQNTSGINATIVRAGSILRYRAIA